jgi:hypothetical protein
MRETCRFDKLAQSSKGIVVKAAHALSLVRDSDRVLAQSILGRDAGWAAIRVTVLGLDAAEGKHETARRVAPISAERENPRHIERGDDSAGGSQAN